MSEMKPVKAWAVLMNDALPNECQLNSLIVPRRFGIDWTPYTLFESREEAIDCAAGRKVIRVEIREVKRKRRKR